MMENVTIHDPAGPQQVPQVQQAQQIQQAQQVQQAQQQAQQQQRQQQEPQEQQMIPPVGRPPGPPPGPPPPPQLPPQMLTTAAQLLDLTDKKLVICMRDGRTLTGILRSWDQFANLVIQATVERVFALAPETTAGSTVMGYFADRPLGIFLVRGENVLLLGEIDLDKEDDPPTGYERADFKLVEKLAKAQKEADKVKETARLKKLATEGFEGENLADMLL